MRINRFKRALRIDNTMLDYYRVAHIVIGIGAACIIILNFDDFAGRSRQNIAVAGVIINARMVFAGNVTIEGVKRAGDSRTVERNPKPRILSKIILLKQKRQKKRRAKKSNSWHKLKFSLIYFLRFQTTKFANLKTLRL